ncbi:hypothetical protein FNF31_02281 [Cafeteria roenbergensis]|uniref:WW domain-containing protein n=1 Tax=Cafeteria roenbergensis TaxID=33653 RepID=A0A5A8DJB3_CAFRO|nr:hypothetical protein FNF31_02281 [Cafeteria roenbergensis]
MAHNWVAYAQQEPPRPAERTPKQEKQAAAVSRLLESTRTAAKSLEDVTTSTFSERRSAARHCDGLMERMLGLISAMRDDGQRQRLHAVRVIGSAWRAFVARRFVTRATRRMWASAVDVTTGRTYYINRRTGDTQWTQPRTFFGALVDRIGRYPRVLAEDMNPDVAATRIQGMFRGFKAKTKLRSLVRSTWRVIPEEGGERKYYFNTVSLATQWNRPLLLGPEAGDHLFALRRGDPGAREVQRRQRRAAAEAAAPGGKRGGRRLSVALPAEDGAVPTSEELLRAAGLATPEPVPTPTGRFAAGGQKARSAAAVAIQASWRGVLGRARVRALLAEVLRKIWDCNYECYYYFNTASGESFWEKPRLLGDDDVPAETAEGHVRTGRRAEDMDREQAASKLQSLVRARRATQKVKALARSVWAKVADEEYGTGFYFNKLTGDSQWERPVVLGDEDLPTERLASPMASATGRHVVERHVDPDFGVPFYFDKRTGESGWDKPALLRGSGLDVLSAEELAAEEARRGAAAEPVEVADVADVAMASARLRTRSALPAWLPRGVRPERLASRTAPAAAALRVQSAWRMSRGRVAAVQRCQEVYEKAIDPSYDAVFYYNRNTGESTRAVVVLERLIDGDSGQAFWYSTADGESTWETPRVVRRLFGGGLAFAAAVEDAQARALEGRTGVREGHSAADLTPDQAATAIQAVQRGRSARSAVRRRQLSSTLRLWSDEWGCFYYFNEATQQAAWLRPLLLREEDDELLRTEGSAGTGAPAGALASARSAVSALGGPPDPSMLSARLSARVPMSVRTARSARGARGAYKDRGSPVASEPVAPMPASSRRPSGGGGEAGLEGSAWSVASAGGLTHSSHRARDAVDDDPVVAERNEGRPGTAWEAESVGSRSHVRTPGRSAIADGEDGESRGMGDDPLRDEGQAAIDEAKAFFSSMPRRFAAGSGRRR